MDLETSSTDAFLGEVVSIKFRMPSLCLLGLTPTGVMMAHSLRDSAVGVGNREEIFVVVAV
jgi:hypothetical protein